MPAGRAAATANRFTRRLAARERQLGFFSTLASASTLEVLAGWGFDWVVIDLEHGQSELGTMLEQLRALEALGVDAVVRPPWNEPVIVKRLLDLGARNLLFPSVSSAEEAAAAVAATRYPPEGVRGVSGNSRGAGYGRNPAYLGSAADGIGVLVQIETEAGLAHLEAIATTPGVDGVFVGPSDLSAALGHLGDAQHEEVQRAVDDAFARLRRLDVPAGYLTVNTAELRRRLADDPARQPDFIALATDVSILNLGLAALELAIESPIRDRGDQTRKDATP